MIEDVLRLWEFQFRKIREDIPIAGSPDRCLFRTVIEDREGKLNILENLEAEYIPHKKKIAQTLSYLSEKELTEVRSYLPLGEDEYIAAWQNHTGRSLRMLMAFRW
jgi:homoserine kinase type II